MPDVASHLRSSLREIHYLEDSHNSTNPPTSGSRNITAIRHNDGAGRPRLRVYGVDIGDLKTGIADTDIGELLRRRLLALVLRKLDQFKPQIAIRGSLGKPAVEHGHARCGAIGSRRLRRVWRVVPAQKIIIKGERFHRIDDVQTDMVEARLFAEPV